MLYVCAGVYNCVSGDSVPPFHVYLHADIVCIQQVAPGDFIPTNYVHLNVKATPLTVISYLYLVLNIMMNIYVA